jgi:hypothetical protein
LRYGGSSNINDDDIPFKIVLDNIFDINNVKKIPINTTISTIIVEIIEDVKRFVSEPKKIIAIVIRSGNLPLHGTNAFVIIAISLSLGESIILQPDYSSCITAKSHAHG